MRLYKTITILDHFWSYIRTLYNDQARLNELTQNTAKFNQQYNWVNQTAGYVDLVSKLNQPTG